ncbi:hypothetical protein [Spirobacillus cienkowskii]|uniref:hypothetical protein n=1 Tax=Spirobacillus cienkowskii TaxID=495820 RepID=UPI0030D1713B
MIVQNLLSIIVLSLCLATLFITLVTYFLYRVKQLLKIKEKNNQQNLEGIFFKKYAPYIKVNVGVKENEFNNKLSDKKTLTSFFGIISAILFLSLISVYIVNYFKIGEKKIDTQTYNILQEKGVLKEYKLNTQLENPKFAEFISEKKINNLKKYIDTLKNKKIIIYENNNSLLKYHKESIKIWSNFFNNYKIKFKLIKNLSNIDKDDLLIIPQLTHIDNKLKEEIQNILNSNINVLLTGPIGVFDENGVAYQKELFQESLGIEFISNLEHKIKYPTVFAANTIPWMSASPGLVLNWYPINQEFYAINRQGAVSCYESNSLAQVKTHSKNHNKIVRGIFFKNAHNRLSWLNIEPNKVAGDLSVAENFYRDLFLVRSLQWLMRYPMAEVSVWKNGAPTVIVNSIEVEDVSDVTNSYKSVFNKYDYPTTIFISSENILKKSLEFENEHSEKIEMATLSENDGILEKTSLSNQFQSIQNARILLEEYWQSRVFGFKPPQSKFDPVTLNSAMQNKLTYFIGDQNLFQLSPLYISENNFLYFPLLNSKEKSLFTSAKIYSPELILRGLLNYLSEVEFLNGGVFFIFPSKQASEKNMIKGVDLFLKFLENKKVWKANFIMVSDWWNEKNNISFDFIYDENVDKFNFSIINKNKFIVTDLYVYLDLPNMQDYRFLQNSNLELIKDDLNKMTILKIKKIDKESTFTLEEI